MYYGFFLCVFCINHTCTTKELFILVGPRMPFRFHQCQYRLLIVNSISLLIWSLNRKNWKYHSKFWKPSCHLLLPSKLHKHFQQDSPEKTTTSTLLHYKLGAATRRVEGTESLKWPRLLCAAEGGLVFRDTSFEFVVRFLPCSERFFSGVLRFSPLLKNQYFQNSNSIWNARTRFNDFLWTP